MDRTGGSFAQRSKPGRGTNTTCLHSHVEATNVDLIDIDSRLIVTKGWWGRGCNRYRAAFGCEK
jgi:hypothetical protein